MIDFRMNPDPISAKAFTIHCTKIPLCSVASQRLRNDLVRAPHMLKSCLKLDFPASLATARKPLRPSYNE